MKERIKDYSIPIAATSAACCSVFVGYPFDLIKTRMQVSQLSTLSCIKSVYYYDGLLGFFRGVTPVLLSVSLLRSLSFTSYSQGKDKILKSLHGSDLSNLMLASLGSGLFTGSVIAFINAPIELIKLHRQLETMKVTRHGGNFNTQVNRQTTKYFNTQSTAKSRQISTSQNFISYAKNIYQHKGIRGLYAGAHLHIARDGIGTALYFSCYEVSKHFLSQLTLNTWIVHILSGGLAGTSCWLVLFPIDVVKSVVQRESLSSKPKFTTARQFLKNTLKHQGFSRLYCGMYPQLIRSFPVHALNFTVYEKVLAFCRTF